MATTAAATLITGPEVVGGAYQAEFTLAPDTTDGNGELTIDLTDHFGYIDGFWEIGQTAPAGYVVQFEHPVRTTAVTSTNIKIGVYEAGADAAALDAVASTDVSTILAGLTICVRGKKAIVSSWA